MSVRLNSYLKSEIDQAGTIMHELGHALGLGHGGPRNLANPQNYQQIDAIFVIFWEVRSFILKYRSLLELDFCIYDGPF